MDDALEASPVPAPRLPRWAVWSILAGMAVAMSAAAGLLFLPDQPSASDIAATQSAARTLNLPLATATPARAAAIPRMMIAPATAGLPSPDPASAPTGTGQPAHAPQPPASTSAPQPTQAPQVTQPSAPKIEWTQEEKYALSWLCWYEVRGMGVNKISACLSVISTVRVRYAYNNSFGVHDVISAINAPGQFTGVNIDTTRPAPDPDLLAAVEQYQAGARGACNGYPYFDSMSGGPMTCVIYGPGGQWEEFHNGRR